jgi:hypothetical protein
MMTIWREAREGEKDLSNCGKGMRILPTAGRDGRKKRRKETEERNGGKRRRILPIQSESKKLYNSIRIEETVQ